MRVSVCLYVCYLTFQHHYTVLFALYLANLCGPDPRVSVCLHVCSYFSASFTLFFCTLLIVNLCDPDPCGANSKCEIIDVNAFACICNAGFMAMADGFRCQGIIYRIPQIFRVGKISWFSRFTDHPRNFYP